MAVELAEHDTDAVAETARRVFGGKAARLATGFRIRRQGRALFIGLAKVKKEVVRLTCT
jgi:hypothetical protein